MKYTTKYSKYKQDKPGKCKNCNGKAISSSGHCLACLTSPPIEDTNKTSY